MQDIIRNWTLFGAFCLALAMTLVSALAGVSFYGIVIRVLIGTSVFLAVGGFVSRLVARAILKKMLEADARRRGAGDEVFRPTAGS
jgi:hypothetical protein